jgi:uncharacterized protein DUF1552
MSIQRISRRRMLLGAGGAALALPFLPSIMEARAAGGAPKRFLFVFTSNGQQPDNWYPYDPPSWQNLGPNARSAAFSAGDISPIMGPEFEALKPKLTLIRGLDFINLGDGGHKAYAPLAAHVLDGALDNPTIDQILAGSNKVYPTPPTVRSVHAMIKQEFQSPTTVSVAEVGGNFEDVPAETSVAVNFQRLFGSFQEPTADPLEEKRRSLRLGVIDRVREDYDALVKSPRLSSDDKDRLVAHAELLHDLHERLSTLNTVSCTKPDEPVDLSAAVDANLPEITRMHIDLVVAAFKCDLTRVATIMLCPGTDLRDFSFLPGGPVGEHHGLSHDKDVTKLQIINQWYAQQYAYLLSRLDETVEEPNSGRTYLDNSLVYWGNEDGCNGYDAHSPKCMPVMLAGSAGGAFTTGRYLDFRAQGQPILYDYSGSPAELPTDFRGRPYNSLLISILQAFGLEPADYERPGQAGIGDYSGNYQSQYSISEGQQPLPYLAT